jgi:hypothetical protein
MHLNRLTILKPRLQPGRAGLRKVASVYRVLECESARRNLRLFP